MEHWLKMDLKNIFVLTKARLLNSLDTVDETLKNSYWKTTTKWSIFSKKEKLKSRKPIKNVDKQLHTQLHFFQV